MPRLSDAGRTTRHTQKVIEFMRAFIARNGHAASIDEIAAGVGCSKSFAYKGVTMLIEAGLVLKTNNKGRCFIPADAARPGAEVYRVSFADDVSEALADFAIARNSAPETVIREAVAAYLGIG